MFKPVYGLLLILSSVLFAILLIQSFGIILSFFIVFVLSIIVSETTFIIETHRYHRMAKANGIESKFLKQFHATVDVGSKKQFIYRDLDYLSKIYLECLKS